MLIQKKNENDNKNKKTKGVGYGSDKTGDNKGWDVNSYLEGKNQILLKLLLLLNY